jgi:predicted Fe-Mo cluster-binding NifX family protein
MKIAVTYANGQVFQHFGHTEQFKIYIVEDGKIVSNEVISTEGQGHCALAGMLSDLGVDLLICGGIGGGAQMALANADIQLRGGVCGAADDAVLAFIKGQLDYNPNVECNHHDHGEGHECHGHHHDHECGHHRDHNHECGHGCHH